MKTILALFLTLALVGCKDDGGGVISKTETPAAPTAPPPFTGPFGGPIANDSSIPDPSEYLPPLTAFDLEVLIFNAVDGGIIELDRDIELRYTPSIYKSVKIRSKPGKRVKLIARNLANMFSTNSNNIEFLNIDFELYNTPSFISNGNQAGSGLVLDRVKVELNGTSSFVINMQGVNLKNSTVLGLSNIIDETRPMIRLRGNNHSIIGNTIVDVRNAFYSGIYLDGVASSSIKNNIIRCHCLRLGAPIRAFIFDNSEVSGNIIYDSNAGRLENGGYFADPDLDGSFGLALQYSHFITDNGIANKVNADRFLIDDRFVPNDPNVSANNSFIETATIPAFGENQLFNYPPTKDWTPICALGTNPTLSTTAVTGWQSYVTAENVTVYYSGALKPGCL